MCPKRLQRLLGKLTDIRFLKFLTVGGSGVFVNMFTLYLLTEFANLHYFIAGLLAIEISILFNFTLNNLWTWGDRRSASVTTRLLKYHIAAGTTAFLGNWCILILLTELWGVHYLISNFIGIVIGALLNFYVNDLWTFRENN